MPSTKPKALQGITVAKRELRAVSLEIKRDPSLDKPGCANIAMGFFAPTFQRSQKDKAKKAQSISGFALGVEAIVKAWSGEAPPDGNEPCDADLLMICKVTVSIRYRVGRDDFKEKEIDDCEWFYHTQLATYANDHLRALLRDTRFSTIPIGARLMDAPE